MIILAGAGLGYSKSRELSKREKSLQQLLTLSICLKGEIRYGNSTLGEAFWGLAGRLQEPYRCLAWKIAEKIKSSEGISLEKILTEQFTEKHEKFHLTEEEQEFLVSLGTRLGYLDREVQLRQMELYEEQLKLHIQEVHEGIPEKKKIYQSLGIMGGVFLAVLLW